MKNKSQNNKSFIHSSSNNTTLEFCFCVCLLCFFFWGGEGVTRFFKMRMEILTDREVDVHEQEHVCDDEIGVLGEHLAVRVVDVYDRVHLAVVDVLGRFWVDILQARLQCQQKSVTIKDRELTTNEWMT